ncbi:hypothetical protein ACTXKB_10265 [Psychrobacter aquimaris]|uniref:hypothetical protein n=1 Tax=Psychrobacter aquimaris TaxID=292733 RepID=UPI003FD4A099
MICKKSVCPQRVAATTVYFQPPAVDTRGLTLAQSVPKGESADYAKLAENLVLLV